MAIDATWGAKLTIYAAVAGINMQEFVLMPRRTATRIGAASAFGSMATSSGCGC